MLFNRIKNLIICFGVSVALIVLMYFISFGIRERQNGFIRLLPSHLLVPGNVIDLKYNSFYIAGLTKDSIYLGNYTTPFALATLDYSIKKVRTRQIIWSRSIKIGRSSKITIDSPFVVLNDGFTRHKFRSNLNEPYGQVLISQTPPFTASANITNNTSIYRCINQRLKNELIIQSLNKFKVNDKLIQNQNDGVFSSDGSLIKVPNTAEIIYVYAYRNQFFCADSNLKLLYKGKTIDTVSHNHITVSKIKSNGQITLSSPPLLVNKDCCVNDKYLFVSSGLSADNEPHSVLKLHLIIDIYDVNNGKYKFSFYVPSLGGKRANEFKVYGNRLVAIYGHFITVYQLKFT